jgi:UDP-N-acetylmuramyl pentapeptide synthase
VFEMGMNGPGQIAFLARLADPDVALVTNVLPVHLEFFDSIDDIAAAKGELFAVLRPDATSVVNLDDGHVRVQATRHAGPRVTLAGGSADLRLGRSKPLHPGALSFSHAGQRTRSRSRSVARTRRSTHSPRPRRSWRAVFRSDPRSMPSPRPNPRPDGGG